MCECGPELASRVGIGYGVGIFTAVVRGEHSIYMYFHSIEPTFWLRSPEPNACASRTGLRNVFASQTSCSLPFSFCLTGRLAYLRSRRSFSCLETPVISTGILGYIRPSQLDTVDRKGITKKCTA